MPKQTRDLKLLNDSVSSSHLLALRSTVWFTITFLSFSCWLLFSQPLVMFTARLPPPACVDFSVVGVEPRGDGRLCCWLCSMAGWGWCLPAGGVALLHPSTLLCLWYVEAMCVWEAHFSGWFPGWLNQALLFSDEGLNVRGAPSSPTYFLAATSQVSVSLGQVN